MEISNADEFGAMQDFFNKNKKANMGCPDSQGSDLSTIPNNLFWTQKDERKECAEKEREKNILHTCDESQCKKKKKTATLGFPKNLGNGYSSPYTYCSFSFK